MIIKVFMIKQKVLWQKKKINKNMNKISVSDKKEWLINHDL